MATVSSWSPDLLLRPLDKRLSLERSRNPLARYLESWFMLDTLTLESFTPHVGGAFRLSTPDGTALTLTLDEARSLASPGTRAEGDRRKREPFRLLFRGPSLPILPQSNLPARARGAGTPGPLHRPDRAGAGRGDLHLAGC